MARPTERIPIIMKAMDWQILIEYLAEKIGMNYITPLQISEIRNVCKKSAKKIEKEWLLNPDWRLPQVLVNLGILENVPGSWVPGSWYYLEDGDIMMDLKLLKPEEILFWGSFGKDGQQPFKWILIKDMTLEHLEACLATQKNMKPLYRKTMMKIVRLNKLKKLKNAKNNT